ncbi:wax ester synthase/diacylglycerol acyltransferase 7-like isoform X1 [Wolffia australiana]
MDADGALYDEPVSPCSRFYLGRYTDLSIDSFVTFQRPIDVVVVREALKSSAKIYPRLRSLVIEAGRGHRWKELAEIEIDNLLKILPEEDEEHAYNWDEDENNRYINEYLASLPSMNPLTRNSPPWEVHVLPRQRRSLVLRFHHSLGDCVSLLALLLFSCDASQEQASISSHGREGKERLSSAGSNAKYAGNSTLPSVQQQSEIEIERNERVMFSTREFDNEVLSRKVASLVLSLEDMKLVKNSVNADILRGLGEGTSDKWGNKMALILISIAADKGTNVPLDYVRKAKELIDEKKKSSEAQQSYDSVASLINQHGLEALRLHYRNLLDNTSVITSNVVGPLYPIELAGNQWHPSCT